MKDFFKSIGAFVKVRCPLPILIVISSVIYYAPFFWAGQRQHPGDFRIAGSLPGFLSTALGLLALRMADDLSDIESDRRFYPERPLPSGRSRTGHIKLFICLATAAVLGLNMPAGRLPFVTAALIVMIYSVYYLILKKRVSAPFPSALGVNLIFFFIPVYAAMNAAGEVRALDFMLAIFLYASAMAHDISHSIKSPSQEKEGLMTFSKLWGGRKAAVVSFGFFLLSATAGSAVFFQGRLHSVYFAVFSFSALFLGYRYIGLIISPVSERSEKFYIEGFLYHLSVLSGLIIDLLLHGLSGELPNG